MTSLSLPSAAAHLPGGKLQEGKERRWGAGQGLVAGLILASENLAGEAWKGEKGQGHFT